MNCKAKPWSSVSIFMPISSCRSMWSWCPPALLVSCLRNLHHMPWKWQSMSMVVVYCSASLNTVPKNLNSLRWWNRCWARFQILRNFSRILLEAPWFWSGPHAQLFHLLFTYLDLQWLTAAWCHPMRPNNHQQSILYLLHIQWPSCPKDTNDSVHRLYPISILILQESFPKKTRQCFEGSGGPWQWCTGEGNFRGAGWEWM